jgi:DNA-dependent RNA polymerase auxiliary subunit epsilon
MNRLNDKIADNRDKKNKLENENYNIESEFIEKLKDMEKESVYLEVKIKFAIYYKISLL